MKKTLLFAVLSYTFSLIGQANTYYPFPTSTAVWNFNVQAVCTSSGSTVEDYSIIINGDTTINSLTYHKLYTPFVQRNVSGICAVANDGYKGAIREDVTNKKVYIIWPQETTDFILYDFNLQVGDTITGALQMSGVVDTVISIDSALVGNTYRKRWNINSCYNISIIEGIGSTFGLIEKSPGCFTDFADFSLTCFQQGSQTTFPNTSSNCQTITSTIENTVEKQEIAIFPNPANGEIQLDFKGRRIKEVQLFNILGELIDVRQATNTNLMRIDNLPTGTVIVVTIDEGNQRTYHKIIISEQ